MISQVFDVFDGYLARKYSMSSKFGDYFDHISDTIKTILLFYILFIKYDLGHSKILIVIFIILLILLLTFVGYQEKISTTSYYCLTILIIKEEKRFSLLAASFWIIRTVGMSR